MKKSLIFLSVLAGVLVLSCSTKEGDPKPAQETPKQEEPKEGEKPISKTEATATINNSSADLEKTRTSIEASKGYQAKNDLQTLPLGDYAPDADFVNVLSFGRKSTSFNKALLAKAIESLHFSKNKPARKAQIDPDFEDAKGVYVYNKSTESFDKTSEVSNYVVFKFPFPLTNATNNAEYTVKSFTYKLINGEEEVTSLEVELKIDSKIEYTVKITADYDTDGEVTSANFKETYGDYYEELILSVTSTKIELSANVGTGTTVIYGFSILSEGIDEDFEKLVLKYTLEDLKVDLTIDASDIETLDQEELKEISSDTTKMYAFFDKIFYGTVSVSDEKLADIRLRSEGLVLIYPDGSRDSYEVLAEIFEEVEVPDFFGDMGEMFSEAFSGEEESARKSLLKRLKI